MQNLNKMKNLTIEKKLELATNALMQLIEPSGAYNPDRLEHAQNCMKNTSEIAKHTLIKIGVKDCKLCANTVCKENTMEKDCYEDYANFKPMKTKLL